MQGRQLSFTDLQHQDCPFKELLDSWDNHCLGMGEERLGYDFLACDQKRLPYWLASVNGVEFDDIEVLPQFLGVFPSYIPMIKPGSKKLINSNFSHYAISLNAAVSKKTNLIRPKLKDRLGLSKASTLILLCYGLDDIIEAIWGKRQEFYESITESQVDIVTSINYSIWLTHPHAERLINIKRGLVVFDEMQKMGFKVIPHLYWSGYRDIKRLADWINSEKNLQYVAINLQTMRHPNWWESGIDALEYLSPLLERDIVFLVSGPSTPDRIRRISSILGNATITNGVATAKAGASKIVVAKGNQISWPYTPLPKSEIFEANVKHFDLLAKSQVELGSDIV